MNVLNAIRRHRRLVAGLAAAFAVAALLQATNTNPAVSQTLSLTAYEAADDPGVDPEAAVWKDISGVNIPLSAQAGSYVAGGSVQTVRAQALHYNSQLYVRVSWPDETDDSSTTKVEDFSDAVALEFPQSATAAVPSICMGQADSAVNIWQWRADSNNGVQDPNIVYANSSVDAYPYTDSLFYTAREANNPYAHTERGPVQSLYSKAFGELQTLDFQEVQGLGKRTSDGWAVVFERKFDTGHAGHAVFAASTRMDMAFAVWDGSQDERNGKKAVSQFVTLGIAAAPVSTGGGSNTRTILFAAGLGLGLVVIGGGLAVYGYRER